MEKAYLCRRGQGLLHRWDVIPVEYEPQLHYENYSDIINERCERCGRVKATLWDEHGYRMKPRYKSGTGLSGVKDPVSYSDNDYREYLLGLSRERTGRKAKPRRSPAKAA